MDEDAIRVGWGSLGAVLGMECVELREAVRGEEPRGEECFVSRRGELCVAHLSCRPRDAPEGWQEGDRRLAEAVKDLV